MLQRTSQENDADVPFDVRVDSAVSMVHRDSSDHCRRLRPINDMCACTESLMEFYNATNGPQWTVRTGWGYVNNCTVSWFGVTCTSTSLILSLPSNSLSGTLPDSLSQIVTLQTLNLNLNKIQGTLPASWKTCNSCARLCGCRRRRARCLSIRAMLQSNSGCYWTSSYGSSDGDGGQTVTTLCSKRQPVATLQRLV